MQIDHCFILAAGMGSRMGEIGKVLPKPLWPVFEKTLLELQVYIAKSFNIKKIYVNAFHGAEAIKERIEQIDSSIVVLFESELLGVGGGIHNFAQQDEINYTGNLLVLNCDVLYFFDHKLIEKGLEYLKDSCAVLFGLRVSPGEKYNRLKIEEDLLVGIEKTGNSSNVTYSGISLINLTKIKPKIGKSDFFDSVANFNSNQVKVLTPETCEYYDFGTKDLYVKNLLQIFSMMKNENNHALLKKFLQKTKAFDVLKIVKESYGSSSGKKTFNFSTKYIENTTDDFVLVLDSIKDGVISKSGLVYLDKHDVL